ncbi:hypothetical protein NLY33_25215 [Mesorhizobium sp. C432A]|uniref:hypothetical protein n=1 Tax=Mesorhizobium sp. C432A TaxID=2956836 RepID=UPI002574E7F5|nr:hypothetical protein [Mesorhizobium sp. C432A]WJI56445.1 hypothetical protein NLY33_25215 [Mesorhizobium sp. C432A]
MNAIEFDKVTLTYGDAGFYPTSPFLYRKAPLSACSAPMAPARRRCCAPFSA